MGSRIAPRLAPILLALCAFAVSAQAAAASGRLDRSYGHGGTISVAVRRSDDEIRGFVVGAGGRAYVLDGSLLLAFQSDGRVARGFGDDGRVKIVPAGGEGTPASLTVDSQGRPLITGTALPVGRKTRMAFVIRFLPNGSRDVSFGSGGEVETDFGLSAPGGAEGLNVAATSIVVDPQDRPVVGGSFGGEAESCGYDIGSGHDPFVGRLTASGAVDKTFAGVGDVVLGGPGGVSSLGWLPGGGPAVFTTACSTPPRFESRSSLFNGFSESGEPRPLATGRPIGFSYEAPMIDPKGRVLEIESPPPAGEGPDALARYLPNGDRDPGFGHHGTVVLDHGYEATEALAVDAESRPIIAVESGGIELRRFRPDGKADPGFGPGGQLTARGAEPRAIALDPRGRIYAVGLSSNSSRTTVSITRFIPPGGR